MSNSKSQEEQLEVSNMEAVEKGLHCQECGQFLPSPNTLHTYDECQDYKTKILKELGYLPVEEVQLEVLPPDKIASIVNLSPTFVEGDRPGGYIGTSLYRDENKIRKDISEATVKHNEAKGTLYRRKS